MGKSVSILEPLVPAQPVFFTFFAFSTCMRSNGSKRLSDWPACENNRTFFMEKVFMYALVTISESVFLPRGPGYWNKQHFGMS